MQPFNIHCPYCRHELVAPSLGEKRSEQIYCRYCHRPIAIYRSSADALQHKDRSIRTVNLDEVAFRDDKVFIEVVGGPFGQAQQIQIPEGRHMLGRNFDRSNADLQIVTRDPSVGRHHCLLNLSKKGILDVMDNDSMTGTFVNGLEIEQGERRRLNDGDVITLGATSILVHIPSHG